MRAHLRGHLGVEYVAAKPPGEFMKRIHRN
jgi:hypothetical protein